jgi:hypothetical protein
MGRQTNVYGERQRDQTVDQKICERRHFTISELSCEFPQISPTLLYEIVIG